MSFHQQGKNLAFEISFLENLRSQAPEDVEVLRVLADDYTRAGRYQEGLAADLELARLFPDDTLVQYNLACSYSLLGHLPESAQTLKRAVQLGYDNVAWICKDPDLENLRRKPEFAEVLRLMKTAGSSQPK